MIADILHLNRNYLKGEKVIMEKFAEIISQIDGIVWGIPMIVILFGTHLFMTFRTGIIQKHLIKGIKLSIAKDDDSEGEISQF